MKHLLVPVDGSEPACRAARFAAELARELGASVTWLYVYDAPTVAGLGMRALSTEEMEETKAHIARGSFEAARRATAEFGVSTDRAIAVGNPAHEILTWIKNHEPDLVVMGRRGLSPLEGVMLGSVSDRILRHSKVPVTVVH